VSHEDNLVTLATFQTEQELLLTRVRLQSAGIECFVPDERLLGLTGNTVALGGFRLQVRESDAGDAATILHENGSAAL
jgi:hypothetical protein